MKTNFFTGLFIAIIIIHTHSCQVPQSEKQSLIFYSYAENADQVHYLVPMVESIRTFAGKFSDAEIWVYIPSEIIKLDTSTIERLNSLNVEVREIEVPEEAGWFFLSGKVYAAALAESEAEGKTDILVFLNYDTVVLEELNEFILPENKKLGYRPVMHKNVGLLYSEPLDSFWRRIYEIMSVDESRLFPMITPADEDTIRPYFNAGLLVVRPDAEILRKWIDYYEKLYQDTILKKMCEQDISKRIFLHQTALTGAIMNHFDGEDILQLSDQVNFPIFFREQFGAKKDFHDITGVVTFRHESYFRNPDLDWEKKITGPKEKIDWIKVHLIAE
ncbi:MAG: hypothetical protein AMS27_04095 [Bacteroides sp. SM23_62_1]|nr:MAG: hypothetical protein AMS27_04095 [Bacteroides sp. SM23_62_1]